MPRSHRITPISRITIIFLFILIVVSLAFNIYFFRTIYVGNTVASVYDGDTFVLENGTRVRLMGVDAPEKGRCGYQEAKDFLTHHIVGRHVRLKNTLTDDYGRLVANVIVEDWVYWTKYITWKFSRNIVSVREWVARAGGPPPAGVPLVGGRGGTSVTGPSEKDLFDTQFPSPDPMVNRAMASHGLAKNMSVNSEYKKVIDDASQFAKERGLGIYGTRCRSLSPPSGCAIKGNMQQEGKYYFIPGCKPYGNVIVDTSFGDAWFCTEAEALTEGFVRSPSCR